MNGFCDICRDRQAIVTKQAKELCYDYNKIEELEEICKRLAKGLLSRQELANINGIAIADGCVNLANKILKEKG